MGLNEKLKRLERSVITERESDCPQCRAFWSALDEVYSETKDAPGYEPRPHAPGMCLVPGVVAMIEKIYGSEPEPQGEEREQHEKAA